MVALNLRAWIFLPVFGIACIASLAYVYSRPAVYLSTARLQIGAPEESADPISPAQTLISGTLLEKIAQRQGAIHPAALQEMLSAAPVSGTNLIELRAEGGERELLPRLLNVWIDVYRQGPGEVREAPSTAALDETRATVRQLQETLASRRRDIEAFRGTYDTASLERDESQAMVRLNGLNAALNDARVREVNAEARLNAMRESMAAGRAVRPPGERANTAELEKRALDLRERMKVTEQDYTPKYLAIDPGYKAARADLARLELQIEREQQSGAQQALRLAEEEMASARQAVLRVQTELAARKQEMQALSERIAEHTALVNELARVEEIYNAGNQRLAQLEVVKKATGPKVTVVDPPSVPDRPVYPDYASDAMLGVAGSGVVGLLAAWLFGSFRRTGMSRSTPLVPKSVETLRRVLSSAEVDALLAAAGPDSVPVIAALLGGRTAPADAPSAGQVESLIVRAARAANLASPAEVTAEVLRYTFVAHQMRQRG